MATPPKRPGTASDSRLKNFKADEVLSYTAALNERSVAVMKRIGLSDRGLEFDHPSIPEGDRLRRHVLFGITREEWRSRTAESGK